MKALIWDDETLGAECDDDRDSGRPADRPPSGAQKLIEAAVELDDDAMSAYLDGNEPDDGDAQAR